MTLVPLNGFCWGVLHDIQCTYCHTNRFKAVPLKSFFSLLIGNLKDPTLILLMAAAMVSSASASVEHRLAFMSTAA